VTEWLGGHLASSQGQPSTGNLPGSMLEQSKVALASVSVESLENTDSCAVSLRRTEEFGCTSST